MWFFKTYTASRIAEIQQTCKDMDIEWSHIPGTANISDILTREYLLPPNSLPWNTPSMKLYQNVSKIPASDISASQLPDSDLKNIVITNNALQVHDPGIGLVQLALYSEVSRQARQQCTKSGEISEQVSVIENILKRCRTYHKAKNVIARIMGLNTKQKETDFVTLQNKSELRIFSVFQDQCAEYCQAFRGAGFHTSKSEENITVVIGRETYLGTTRFLLVPPHTVLYTLMAQTFHQKYHLVGSPVYILKQILDH